jgi:hypothetical protein
LPGCCCFISAMTLICRVASANYQSGADEASGASRERKPR